jgi:hypothetical protein
VNPSELDFKLPRETMSGNSKRHTVTELSILPFRRESLVPSTSGLISVAEQLHDEYSLAGDSVVIRFFPQKSTTAL